MVRLRLRFLLQEFDLVGCDVLIGRSPECHITIEDPMVSRRHARIRVDEGKAFVSDVGSRNGVKVNGKIITAERQITDGDRIRLGTQELVFSVVHSSGRIPRTTGYLMICKSCGTPFPDETPQCPHCGAASSKDDETISGLFSGPGRRWTTDLLYEVLGRAFDKGNHADIHRMMLQVTQEMDQCIQRGDTVPVEHMEQVADFAINFANRYGKPSFLSWLLGIHQRNSMLPSEQMLNKLETLNLVKMPEIRTELGNFTAWLRQSVKPEQQDVKQRLSKLENLLELEVFDRSSNHDQAS